MMKIDYKKLKTELMTLVPESVVLVFGDTVSKTAATVSVLVKGLKWFIDKNKDWWDSYITGYDLMEFTDDYLKSAEYLQFIRGILIQVAYETSELKREYCKKFALNYSKMMKENQFSEVMYYQTLLSRLNESHLKFLIFMSNFKQMSGGKEWYAPLPLQQFEMNKYANGTFKNQLNIPMDFIEPIISDLTSFGILEQRKEQNMLLLTFMGMHFIDYLVK